MGRTKRKRKKRQINKEFDDLSRVFLLQKSLRLKCTHIKIDNFTETGRGIKCKKKLNQGDILIALPLHHLITADADCDIFSILRLNNKSPQFILSVILIYEAHLKTNSKYFNYIESSPKNYTNLYFCTKEERQLLPLFMNKELLPQITKLDDLFEELFKDLKDKKCPHCSIFLTDMYTKQQFTWAWFTVNTRSVYYKDAKNLESIALAPFLDMFNHSNDASIQQYVDYENNLYILKTLIQYKKHDQVFIKYGPHSNLKLLVEYGFILPENPHDFIEFSFQEVIESIKEIDSNFGEIPKYKYNFIISNDLHRNLTLNKEFSWSFNGLIYVLTTKDENLSVLQSKTYSNNFNNNENDLIKKIGDFLTGKKLEELRNDLAKMEMIKNSSESFKLAKNLMKIYINVLM